MSFNPRTRLYGSTRNGLAVPLPEGVGLDPRCGNVLCSGTGDEPDPDPDPGDEPGE